MKLFFLTFNSLILLYFFTLKSSFGIHWSNTLCPVDLNFTSSSLSKYINKTEKPCRDFHSFVCGNWYSYLEGVNDFNYGDVFVKNDHILSGFKKRILRGDKDSYSKALKKLNKMLEKCESLDDGPRSNCIKKVENFGFYAYASYFVKNLEESNMTTYYFEMIAKIFEASREVLIEQIIPMKTNILSSDARKEFIKKLKILRFYRGSYQRLKDINMMEECYDFFEFADNCTVDEMLNDIKHYDCMIPEDYPKKEKCVNYIHNMLDGSIDTSRLINSNAYYRYKINRFLLNPNIIRHPCFDCRFPKSFQYGCIGFVIGQEIMKTLDETLRLQIFKKQADKNKPGPYQKRYDELKKCFTNKLNQLLSKNELSESEKKNLLNDIVADNAGIKVAYTAYKLYLKYNKNVTEGPIPGFDHLSHDQLFFFGYGRSFCEHKNDKWKTTIITPRKGRPLYLSKLLTITNNEAFSEAYKCDINEPMNPREKCSIW